jgi:hypothetical protein
MRRGSGPREATGARRWHPAAHSPEGCENRNTFKMFRIRTKFLDGTMLSTKWGSEFEAEGLAPQECGFPTFSLQIC